MTTASPQKNLFHAYRGTLFTAIGLIVAYLLLPVLTPFIIAGIVAYMCDPLVDKLCLLRLAKWRINRSLGTALVMLLLILLLVALLLVILPLLEKEFSLIGQKLPHYFANLHGYLSPLLQQTFGVDLSLDSAQIQGAVTQHWKSASGVFSHILTFAGNQTLAFIGLLTNIALIPIVLFYLLRDWDEIVAKITALIPRTKVENTALIMQEIDAVLAQFMRGQLSVMVIMSLFYLAGLWLVGLELFLPIALLTGLLGFVPYLGLALGLILALLAGLLQFNDAAHLLPIVLVFGVGQVLEGMLITPKLVGERIGLHPVAVIFALLAGAQLFGFAGVLLALPVSAAIAVYLRHAKAAYLTSDTYLQ